MKPLALSAIVLTVLFGQPSLCGRCQAQDLPPEPYEEPAASESKEFVAALKARYDPEVRMLAMEDPFMFDRSSNARMRAALYSTVRLLSKETPLTRESRAWFAIKALDPDLKDKEDGAALKAMTRSDPELFKIVAAAMQWQRPLSALSSEYLIRTLRAPKYARKLIADRLAANGVPLRLRQGGRRIPLPVNKGEMALDQYLSAAMGLKGAAFANALVRLADYYDVDPKHAVIDTKRNASSYRFGILLAGARSEDPDIAGRSAVALLHAAPDKYSLALSAAIAASDDEDVSSIGEAGLQGLGSDITPHISR